jgi:hypothetical protein
LEGASNFKQINYVCVQIESFILKITHKIIEFPSIIAPRGWLAMGPESRSQSKTTKFQFHNCQANDEIPALICLLKPEPEKYMKNCFPSLFYYVKSIINTKAL